MGSSPPLPPRSPPKGGTTKPKPSLKLAKPGAMAFNYPKVCLPPITTCPTCQKSSCHCNSRPRWSRTVSFEGSAHQEVSTSGDHTLISTISTDRMCGGLVSFSSTKSAPPSSEPLISPLISSSTHSPFEFHGVARKAAATHAAPQVKKKIKKTRQDVECTNKRELLDGGFYHGPISHEEAKVILDSAPEGSVLVRDSATRQGGYTLSLKLSGGWTGRPSTVSSIRINFLASRGKYQMDRCHHSDWAMLPEFDSVTELVEFYVRSSTPIRSNSPAFNNLRDAETGELKTLCVRTPVPASRSPPSLAHLSRLAVNRAVGEWEDRQPSPPSVEELYVSQKVPQMFNYRNKNIQSIDMLKNRREIPARVNEYLKEYPYTI